MTVIKIVGEEPFNGLVSINNLKSIASLALHTAASEVSEMLRHSGVRHTVVGGVAVSCNGYARTTSNVDYAVEDAAFEYRNRMPSTYGLIYPSNTSESRSTTWLPPIPPNGRCSNDTW